MRRTAQVLGMMVALGGAAWGQEAPEVGAAQSALPAAPAAVSGGTIKGSVKAGTIPLPGVTVTATNTLTGKKFATTTDVDGAYGLAIARNGRYVVKVELAAFASETKEVVVNAAGENGGAAAQVAKFGMQLASRVAAAAETQVAAAGSGRNAGGANAQRRGVQALSLTGAGDELTTAASAAAGGNAGAELPTLSGLGGGDATDSVAVSGQVGQTNGLASFSEDEIRQRVQDAVGQARAQGLIPQGGGDPTNAIVSALGGMMQGGGFGGPGGGGPGGGGRGGRGGGGWRLWWRWVPGVQSDPDSWGDLL